MKKDEIQNLVTTGIDSLQKSLAAGESRQLKEVLAVMARFPRYSFNNCLLIFQQRPDAREVQGFHAWKKIGRTVKKGEKGIGISAPLSCRTDESDSDDKMVRGFRVVHVFDISQTEGKELPRLAQPEGEADKWIPAVEELIRSHDIDLRYRELAGNAEGVSSIGKIVIQPDLPPAKRLSVLVHELAHELLHDRETRRALSIAVKETEAEAVAHVVCNAMGVDSLEHSSEYIRLQPGGAEAFADCMKRIQRCASGILQSLQAEKMNPQTEPAPTRAA